MSRSRHVVGASIVQYQIQRAHANNPTRRSKNIASARVNKTTFLCCVDRVLVSLATLNVRSIPAGVTSNAQAKISAIGNPVSTSTITSRKLQPGNAPPGKPSPRLEEAGHREAI